MKTHMYRELHTKMRMTAHALFACAMSGRGVRRAFRAAPTSGTTEGASVINNTNLVDSCVKMCSSDKYYVPVATPQVNQGRVPAHATGPNVVTPVIYASPQIPFNKTNGCMLLHPTHSEAPQRAGSLPETVSLSHHVYEGSCQSFKRATPNCPAAVAELAGRKGSPRISELVASP